MRTGARIAALGLLALALGGPAARAQTAEEFYRGRHVDLIVATTPGGGVDLIARIFARAMPRYLPGNPTITVKNMPGGGGIEAANFLYNVAPKDGSVFGMVLQGVAFLPLFGEKQARYDATKFTWIGNANTETGIFYVWHSSPVESVRDLMTREVPAAATDGGSATAFNYRILNNLTGTKIKTITGYPGSNESFLALERGEVEGFFSVWSTLKGRGNLMRDHLVRPLVQVAMEKHPDLPDVPAAAELVKNEADRAALALAVAPTILSRPFVAPPGLPPDRAKALRTAFLTAAKDKTLQEEATKGGVEVAIFQGGEEMAAMLKRFYATPPDVVARVAVMSKGN
jgi:tripartite-type tricarboxylate transporter receptor subunit TctC